MQFLIRLPAGSGQMCVGRAMANGASTCCMQHSLISLIFLRVVICLSFLEFRMVGNFLLYQTWFCPENLATQVRDTDQQCKQHHSANQSKEAVGYNISFLMPHNCDVPCLKSMQPEGSEKVGGVREHCQSRVDNGHTKPPPATAVLCPHSAVDRRGRAQYPPAMQKHTQTVPDKQMQCPNLGVHRATISCQTCCAQVSSQNRVGGANTSYQTHDRHTSGHHRPSDSLLQPLRDMMEELRKDPSKGKATMHFFEQPTACACEAMALTSQPLGCSLNKQQCAMTSSSTLRLENKMQPFQGVVVDLANVLRQDEAGYLHSGRSQAGHQQCPKSPAQVGPKCVWNLGQKDMLVTAQAMTDRRMWPHTMRYRRRQLLHGSALLMLCASYAVLYCVAWAFRTPITHARVTCRLCCGIYRRRPKVLLAEPLVCASSRWLREVVGVYRAQLTSFQSAEVDCRGSPSFGRLVRVGSTVDPRQHVHRQQVPSSRSTSRKWTDAHVQEVDRWRSRWAEVKTAGEDVPGVSAKRVGSFMHQLSRCLQTTLLSDDMCTCMLQPFSVAKDAQHTASYPRVEPRVLAWTSASCHLLQRQITQFLCCTAQAAQRRIMQCNKPPQPYPFPCDRKETPMGVLRSSMGHSCRAEQSFPQNKSPQMNTARVHFGALFMVSWWRNTLGLHKEDSNNYGSHHEVSTAEAGRKSGQGCTCRTMKLHAILVLIILLQCITTAKATLEPSVGGSAVLRPPECPPYEASRHTAQLGAEQNGQSTTTGNRHVTRPVRKRAFIRAQNRAARNGETVYRGRRVTAIQLGVQRHVRTPPSREQGSISCPKKAFRYLCWNAGGLTMEKYQELKHWLTTSEATKFHLICIQETQWSNDSEYELGHWSVIHSGSGSRSGGLLCIIHRSLAAPAQIKSQAPIPGRLLHIRLTTEPAIDLLIVYQHSWLDNQASRDKLLSQRADIWAKISGWIAAVPRRNLCCIMGDFNTEVRHDGRCIGRGTMSQREPRQRDWHMWSDMTKTHDLCLLNTWGKQGTQARAYVPANGRGGSQIDFIALRQIHLQPWCKAVQPFNLPFANVHGMRHIALTGQLPRPSLPRKANSQSSNMLTLRKAQRIMSQDPEVLQRMRQVLRATPLQCHSGGISEALSQAWSTAVQMGERARGNASVILPVLQSTEAVDNQSQEFAASTCLDKPALIRCLWQLRRQIQQCQQKCRVDMSSLLQRWRLACTYSIQSRKLSKECRLNKARKITKLVQEAESIGGASLWQVQRISKKIAPKTKTGKIQFRDDSGFPLSNQAELEMIKTYYNALYNPDDAVDKTPTWDRAATHLNITLQEVQHALQKLPKTKTLPKHHAPAILWATFSEEVAPLVYRDLSQWCTDMTQPLPHEWSNAQVCLLTKPSKPPHTPAALRPISLLPPVAKALAHIAAQRLQPYLQPLLEKFQQFAYVRGREVHDAIERAAAHCAQARVLMSTQQRSIHKLREGVRCAPCRGGLTLSLDISKAFDKLPRHKIAEALDFAGVDSSLKSLILEIQAQATLEFHHHDHTAKIGTSSGVRQGCGLSPALWAIYTCLILQRLHQHMLPEQLTVFADDFLGQWIIRHTSDIPLAIKAMETLISIIQEDGLEISTDKTIVLDGLRGPDKGKNLKPHIFKDPQKGKCLKLNSPPYQRQTYLSWNNLELRAI